MINILILSLSINYLLHKSIKPTYLCLQPKWFIWFIPRKNKQYKDKNTELEYNTENK